ncbi:MAG TPA: hypothetical protein P5279_16305 [Anaerohalosphaeraceae bacterium]|nr:hypothetical protein [Anaerohalosphaeraceae bacterium]HRT52052.1 hypothetical protein [Anaerohalosphaeraceae bacterium]HRT88129.1 hypothetical protein [Anaerohalosphaeraceae bacterium]
MDGRRQCLSEAIVAHHGVFRLAEGMKADNGAGGTFPSEQVIQGYYMDVAALLAGDFDKVVDAVEVVAGGGDVGHSS